MGGTSAEPEKISQDSANFGEPNQGGMRLSLVAVTRPVWNREKRGRRPPGIEATMIRFWTKSVHQPFAAKPVAAEQTDRLSGYPLRL
jgi:hypothetical protein